MRAESAGCHTQMWEGHIDLNPDAANEVRMRRRALQHDKDPGFRTFNPVTFDSTCIRGDSMKSGKARDKRELFPAQTVSHK